MPSCIGGSWNEMKLTFTSWFELKWGNENFKLANETKIQNAKKYHISVCLKIWPNYCIFIYNHHWQLMKSIGVMTSNHCHSSWKNGLIFYMQCNRSLGLSFLSFLFRFGENYYNTYLQVLLWIFLYNLIDMY